VHQQIGGDAAGVIPVEPPLEVAVGIPVVLGRGAQEAVPIGILRIGLGGNHVAPGRLVGQPVAIPEGAHEMDVAHHALLMSSLAFL
jgi:hypothetical protein